MSDGKKLPGYEPEQQDISLQRIARRRGEETVPREPRNAGAPRPAHGAAERTAARKPQRRNNTEKTEGQSNGTAKKKSRSSVKWLVRLVIVPLTCVLTLIAGLITGYVVVGKGTVAEALNFDTWRHLFQLVFA
ncbi:DNA-directed RNA polymerase subunit beta [Paenibacillus thiaminolyticus]|uniref:DNA-directed RNA polymerase subunit beta n=1 Tax=Paenibacillus thiaminolyticus TaxID=49283 RepID=A0AAP9DUK8_PANTH|nr:DNA-directed RNA polymerase subunit beta [Paenibacillus thiaminolyticus]MCY9538226.1 DNA-directed RNA polymerase subunit beta [Paenibacillus thiaminolyticus]MCY9602788.1 DNA-directed RNA polymerase subunit beta [Paenibacillus thiaminolyticus]MCY9610773.1 DNA-directed RNA polymerase subunit beta [Paenibacillus thiaminolyticus]MCY9615043.1 DNA-directed RNA polymerase subunit beta [Paenibacillus thiaminolyticus]MCY9621342.1 DNA-directed RNA polymerase subunit beta [Paenibacillus thiaminolyticu